MRKYYSIPLVFFLLAALLGLFLRWQFINPTPGVNFSYFVHGHSHAMFLGWVFNVIYLASIEQQIHSSLQQRYLKLFIFLQALVFAMTISFPIQGYGAFSIAFSTAHTLTVMIFIPLFFRRSRARLTASYWFLRAAWIFFFLSTLGPFALGYLMASGSGNPTWNNISIYYYLHFQYNGFFLFGVFSLFFRFLEDKGISFNQEQVKSFGRWMAFACIPTYFLSVLFAEPPAVFYWVGGAGAIIQLIALSLVLGDLREVRDQLKSIVLPQLLPIGYFILAALIAKALLQLASAHPYVAGLAFSLRPVVIAYLHLVLVGIISLFLLAWYVQMNLMNIRLAQAAMSTLVFGFIGSEIVLVLLPWWDLTPFAKLSSITLIFIFSVFMLLAAILFVAAYFRRREVR